MGGREEESEKREEETGGTYGILDLVGRRAGWVALERNGMEESEINGR